MTAHLTAVLILTVAVCAAADLVCPYKECTCTKSVINCRDLGLTSLELQPGYVRVNEEQVDGWTMDISNNNISSINDLDLPANLYMFISIDNPLDHVSDGAFQASAHSLDIVHVRNSSLTTVPRAVTALPNLTTLVMTHHNMTYLSDLTSMTSLKHLGLWTNGIISSTDDVLPTGLDTLHIYDNKLTEVPESLSDLSELTLLRIDSNNIRSISSTALPSTLMFLDVSNNDIQDMPTLTFTGPPVQLATFNLSGNPLKDVGDHALDELVNLQTIDVSGTRILHLPKSLMTLTGLTKVKASNMHDLACDCGDSTLAQWYNTIPGLTIHGDCMGSDLRVMLDYLAQFCPPVVG